MTAYYHGGPRGLRAILPPSKTGARSTGDYTGARHIHDQNAVYVTTDYGAAVLYACGHTKGCVYQVQPHNLRFDPDCTEPGLSFECDRADVIARFRLKGKELKLARRALVA